ncbi:MAG TPA: hypothetical protein PLU39_09235 [Armatimonadota bacterium]|jgi:hypothetical protein|nr:hypothetical protein [Armatimonadota bacterium]HOJ21026.1 hypothetical protein [Armatimonadota bacterium]HOM80311.1 hypothetical protein [Armatimonadota bacterium]HPO71312.1 hypothetical protein [Armatimonadota bacterium]HPT98039.1 hypothetical protein [Armatimonadota bacterium]
MQRAFSERKGTARRLMALVAICALLLAGALASYHQHGGPLPPAGPSYHVGAPGAHPDESDLWDSMDGCLACLWTRAAVGCQVAAGPTVIPSQAAERVVSPDESGYRHIATLSRHSRAPPSSSL